MFVSLLALLVVVGCNRSAEATAVPELAATPAVETRAGSAIVALGTVRPARTVQLSFRAGGPIAAVSVRVGHPVQAGDLLAELDATSLQLALQNAEAQVAIEQAALDALLGGPGQAEVERAEAAHAQQVAQAESALREAQLQLEQARLAGPDADLEGAQVERARLDLQLAQARAESPQAEVTVAQVGLARARDALETAQDEYNKALDRPWEPQRIRDALAEGVQRAQWDVEVAQARLDAAQSALRAHALGLEVLTAQGATIELQAARALGAQAAYSVTLALRGARVEQVQRELDALNAWTNPLLDPAAPEAIDQARARLRQAQVAVEQVRWQLDGAQLLAPFDGVISAVDVRQGEWAAGGRPVVDLIDAAHWTVETRNVSESDIGRIRIGQQAEVQVLALESQFVRGEVAAISPVAVVQQGDTTYTLTIALDATELALWSGMNAQVRIEVE
jgi:multidrug resistance efflux pump